MIVVVLTLQVRLSSMWMPRNRKSETLSTQFHKEPLTSEEPFCFTKGSLWWKKVLQIIKRYGRDGSWKNLWLNGSLWNQKWFFYGIAWRTFWSTFIFKSVGGLIPPKMSPTTVVSSANLTLRGRLYRRRYQLVFFKNSAKDIKNTLSILVVQISVIHQLKLWSVYFFVYTHEYNKTLWFWKKKRKQTGCALCLLHLRELLFKKRH